MPESMASIRCMARVDAAAGFDTTQPGLTTGATSTAPTSVDVTRANLGLREDIARNPRGWQILIDGRSGSRAGLFLPAAAPSGAGRGR